MRNSQPKISTRGQRNSQKLLAGVDIASGQFVYRHQTEYFNAESYIHFLEHTLLPGFYKRNHRIYLIQDNASYHKHQEVRAWFQENQTWWHVHHLPPYSPEFNAAERLWWHTRKSGTHNRYFATSDELRETVTSVFRSMQRNPEQIRAHLLAFS